MIQLPFADICGTAPTETAVRRVFADLRSQCKMASILTESHRAKTILRFSRITSLGRPRQSPARDCVGDAPPPDERPLDHTQPNVEGSDLSFCDLLGGDRAGGRHCMPGRESTQSRLHCSVQSYANTGTTGAARMGHSPTGEPESKRF
jgi:hypothetical protein